MHLLRAALLLAVITLTLLSSVVARSGKGLDKRADPTPASTTAAAVPAQTTSSNVQAQATTTQAVAGNTSQGNATAPNANLPTSASLPYTVQPGRVTFLTPTSSKSMAPLYRVDPKENVTFVWSFQSLMVRPINLTLAAVGPQKATYTVAQLDGMATSYVWQLSSVLPQTPLMNGLYDIMLYDQRGPTAVPQPGWLQAATSLTIAFYSPEAYQPWTNTNYCPLCLNSGGTRAWRETIWPWLTAFGVASFTSALCIYGLLY